MTREEFEMSRAEINKRIEDSQSELLILDFVENTKIPWREYRDATGLSVPKLIEQHPEVDVSVNTIYQDERGKTDPYLTSVVKHLTLFNKKLIILNDNEEKITESLDLATICDIMGVERREFEYVADMPAPHVRNIWDCGHGVRFGTFEYMMSVLELKIGIVDILS